MKRYSSIFVWLLFFAALTCVLQATNAYNFYYTEQLQLFLFSWGYVLPKLMQIGGLTLVIGEFIVQFFIHPFAGAVIASALITLAGILARVVINRVVGLSLFLFSIASALSLLPLFYSSNSLVQGVIAYILCLSALLMCLGISRDWTRTMAGALCTAFLFFTAGPVALLFVVLLIITESLKKRKRWYLPFVSMLLFIALSVCCLSFGAIEELRFAILPDAYFIRVLRPPVYLYFSWVILPLSIILAWLYGHSRAKSRAGKWIERMAQILIPTVACALLLLHIIDRGDIKAKQLDYYARNGKWDEILERSSGQMTNYINIAFLNMALIEKGELAERMFEYDQRGLRGMMIEWNRRVFETTLISDLFFSMGEIASSQKMAFEANVSATGVGSPRNLKRLVQTNIIFGEYAVAYKYLTILERTYGYRKWAIGELKYLYNDSLVNSDPLYGAKRNILPQQSRMALLSGFIEDLLFNAKDGSGISHAIELAGSAYLLAKDMSAFKALIEEYYGTDGLPKLPKLFQEAVILLDDRNRDQWSRYGVSTEVIVNFERYSEQVMRYRNNPKVMENALRATHGDTYWFYYIYRIV